MNELVFWSILIFWWITSGVLSVMASCQCGKIRKWYFRVNHEKTWVMGYDLGFVILFMLFAFFESGYGAIGWSMWVVYHVRKVWFHEKDKIRKKMKSAGRVYVKDNGGLGVRA